MADSTDSEAEVTFESADEGEEGEEVVEEVTTEEKDTADSSQSQDHESTASTTEHSAQDDAAAKSSRTEGSVDESRTKAEDEMEETDGRKQDDEKSGEHTEGSVNKTERTAASEEAGDVKDIVQTDDGNEAEGTPGEEKEQKEPEGEEIVNRGAPMTEDTESNAKAGGAPQNASAAPASGGGSWGWGGWGTSLLSSAAATVTKVSDNVGECRIDMLSLTADLLYFPFLVDKGFTIRVCKRSKILLNFLRQFLILNQNELMLTYY